MKKLGIVLVLSMMSITMYGQSTSFGIKGGLNFGSTGDISAVVSGILDNPIDGDGRIGYHAGVYAQLKFAGIFIQPELVFTRLNTEFEQDNLEADYNFSKLDIPILLGFKLVGPLNVKVGPAFQVVLNNELEGLDDIDIRDPENTFTVGFQAGVGVQLGRLGLDARYEGSFQDNDALSDNIEDGFGFVVDSRPSQVILSISYNLSGGDN